MVAGSSVNPRLEVRADVAPGPGNAVAASSRVMQGLVRLARPASEGPLAYLLGLSGSTGVVSLAVSFPLFYYKINQYC